MVLYAPFTALQNVTGQPAINMPLHWSVDRLPIGVLQLAAQMESAQPWIDRKPAIWS
jgi:amidase